MGINKVIGGAFLIGGTCIGAGMLALPVALAGAGFYWSLLLMICCWALLFYTALLVLEVNINLPTGANFIAMSRATLGRTGETVTWLVYLLLLYSLIAAYLSGASDLVLSSLPQIFIGHKLSWLAPIPLLIVVGIVVFIGAIFVDYLGRILLFGLIASYALLVAIATPHVDVTQLTGGQPKYLFTGLTIVAAAFGYHVTLPSLRHYLRSDIKKLIWTILLGSLIPLVVYIIWELIIFGIIPLHGSYGLMAMLKQGNPGSSITQAIAAVAHSSWVTIGVKFFIFFAIASSFLGISFSLFDFLADGLAIKKTVLGKVLLLLLTFLPPFIYFLYFPHGFILALSYAGIFVAILHGILPALMAWSGRRQQRTEKYQVTGGGFGLLLVMLFSLLIILSQLTLVIK